MTIDRLSLIADRALALPPRPPRTCTFCQLEYRHAIGVTYGSRWYCDLACARQGPRAARAIRKARQAKAWMDALIGPRGRL